MTEEKTLDSAGGRPSSTHLKEGLPLFYQQFLDILLLERPANTKPVEHEATVDSEAVEAIEVGNPEETIVAKTAALHGTEMLRLGYTLSHVVHAYGAMCQSITELAETEQFSISASGFHDLNQCLDVAIAGAVTEYQKFREIQEQDREIKHLGHLTHELRNALVSATISLQLIKKGTVGLGGNTGRVLENSLKRMQEIIDRSLAEVRLRVDPIVHVEIGILSVIIDQILVTARIEASSKNQTILAHIDQTLIIEADQQAFESAVVNLIQNAIKFTHDGGTITVRGIAAGENIVIEVEDECGGLSAHTADLFAAFTQQHDNREGLGLGLTIAQRAIMLNNGTIDVRNIPGKGCVFTVTLPKKAGR